MQSPVLRPPETATIFPAAGTLYLGSCLFPVSRAALNAADWLQREEETDPELRGILRRATVLLAIRGSGHVPMMRVPDSDGLVVVGLSRESAG